MKITDNDMVRPTFWLGFSILVVFALIIFAAIIGSYVLLARGIKIQDVGIVAAIFGFMGTALGYVAANVQQVIGYYFGTSFASKQKTEMLFNKADPVQTDQDKPNAE